MSWGFVPGQPGIRSAKVARHKVVFRGGFYPDILPGGQNIDATKSRDPSNTDDVATLQTGLLMGKITSGGLYAPSILGTLPAVAVGATSITVSVAVAVELNRRVGASGTFKATGPPVAGGTVVTETITYSAVSVITGVITCTATVNAFIIGSFLQPTDGSETPITFINDGYGIPVLEFDGTAIANVQFAEVPIVGHIYTTNIVNFPTDTSLRTWLVTRLNDIPGGKFTFDYYWNP